MTRFLLCTLLLLLPALTQAQDVILKTDGQEVPGKVVRITPQQVTYLAGPDTVRLAATEVFLIRYANGTKDVLAKPQATASTAPLTTAEAEAQARTDAHRLFRAKGAYWGTFGATFLGISTYGLTGVVTGVAIATATPKKRNIIPSRPELLQNPDYVRAYQQEAKRKKLGKAAAGFGTAIGAGLAATVVLVAIVLSNHY